MEMERHGIKTVEVNREETGQQIEEGGKTTAPLEYAQST